MPDYRGLFLRGVGGNAAAIGVQQGDAIRKIAGEFWGHAMGWYDGAGTGPFYNAGCTWDRGSAGNGMGAKFGFDVSKVVPTSNENRPINKAVRYLIRAKS